MVAKLRNKWCVAEVMQRMDEMLQQVKQFFSHLNKYIKLN
jgi:hypothetical protein